MGTWRTDEVVGWVKSARDLQPGEPGGAGDGAPLSLGRWADSGRRRFVVLPGHRAIELAEAVRRLGVSRATLHERVRAQDPVIRGLAPRTELNPTSRWLVSLDDVEAELRRKGRLAPSPATEPSVDAMRVQMLQGALDEEKDRRIAQLEALVADKDAEIGRLRAQLATLGRAVEEQLVAAGRTVAAMTGVPAG